MVKTTLPKTFAEAEARGYQIHEENFTSFDGELHRHGILTLERINRDTGDAEEIYMPFTAVLTVGPARKYRMHRHAYLTPTEAAEFSSKARTALAQKGKEQLVNPRTVAHSRGTKETCAKEESSEGPCGGFP
jgi:hypothetical protein